MASIEEILNDSERHLDHLVGEADRVVASNLCGNDTNKKLMALTALAVWWTPDDVEELKEEGVDPVGHLLAALGDIINGKGRFDANLLHLADHNNLQDILTLTLLALSYMRSAMLEFFGPEVGAQPVFDEEGRPVRLGYIVDLFTFDEAHTLLVEIEEHLSKTPADTRLPLVFAITALLERCPIPFRDSYEEICEGEFIQLRWSDDEPSVLVLHEWE